MIYVIECGANLRSRATRKKACRCRAYAASGVAPCDYGPRASAVPLELLSGRHGLWRVFCLGNCGDF